MWQKTLYDFFMGADQSGLEIKEKVINQLRGVVDPELGSDIVDLGMVKEIDFKDTGDLHITIALTTAGCPLKAQIQKDVRLRMKNVVEVSSVKIEWTEFSGMSWVEDGFYYSTFPKPKEGKEYSQRDRKSVV